MLSLIGKLAGCDRDQPRRVWFCALRGIRSRQNFLALEVVAAGVCLINNALEVCADRGERFGGCSKPGQLRMTLISTCVTREYCLGEQCFSPTGHEPDAV